ncbi:MAG: SRPBCC family protein [Moraxellaceae bacterium]
MIRTMVTLELEVERRFTHAADTVWELAGDFGGLQAWLPGVLSCRVEGLGVGEAVRILAVADGSVTRERLEALDHAGRRYSYSIIEAQGLGVENRYLSTFLVLPQEQGHSLVRWSARFCLPLTMPARKRKQQRDRIAGMYDYCLSQLAAALRRDFS